MFVTYILYSETIQKFYIGYTSNIELRLQKHNSSGSTWTKRGVPWELVFEKQFINKTDAIKFERYLKRQKSSIVLSKYIAGWRSSISPGP